MRGWKREADTCRRPCSDRSLCDIQWHTKLENESTSKDFKLQVIVCLRGARERIRLIIVSLILSLSISFFWFLFKFLSSIGSLPRSLSGQFPARFPDVVFQCWPGRRSRLEKICVTEAK